MMSKKVSKAILWTVPLVTVIACASGEETDEKESAGGKGGENRNADSPGEVGKWGILNEPQFGQEFGMFKSVKLEVRNVSDSDDEPWLEIRLTNKKGDLVTTYDCIGETVEPGQKTTLDCSSLDDYAEWSDYKIQNAF